MLGSKSDGVVVVAQCFQYDLGLDAIDLCVCACMCVGYILAVELPILLSGVSSLWRESSS